MKITLVFENCEELTFNTNSNTRFYLENIKTNTYLNSEEGCLTQEEIFEKGYIFIPENIAIDEQEGISAFINDGECSLDRILNYNDVTHIIYDNKCIQPPWKGYHNNQYNLMQKSYCTPKRNVVVDWGDSAFNEFVNSCEERVDEVTLDEFLEYIDRNFMD